MQGSPPSPSWSAFWPSPPPFHAYVSTPSVLPPSNAPLHSNPFLPSPVSVRAANNRSSSGCLRRFASHENEYRACLTKPCFIFLQEEPFINLDPSMTADIHTQVFPCHSPRSKFKLLSGIAFDVMDKTAARDAMCVWGGPDCLFNNAVNFISEQAHRRPLYKFAFTGLLLELSERRRDTILQSISIVQEDIAIFGPRVRTGNPFPLWRLVRPFEQSAWGLWIALIVAFSAFFWITVKIFSPRPLNFRTLLDFITDDHSAAPKPSSSPSLPYHSIDTMPDDPEPQTNLTLMDRALTYKVARRLLKTAIGAASLVFIGFYDIAVVNFLFIQMSAPVVKDLSRLTEEELRYFSVEKNAATEDVFIRKVYGDKRPLKLPWKRCDSENLCFDWALDKSNETKYVVTFRSTGTYNLLKREACDNMTLYGTKKHVYSFGAGWVFGSTINKSFISRVNRGLLDMLQTGELTDIIENDVGTLNTPKCSPMIKSIDERIMGISVLILVAPFLCLILVLVFIYGYKVHSSVLSDYHSRRLRAKDHISSPCRAYDPHRRDEEMLRSRERERLSAVKAILKLSLKTRLTTDEQKILARNMNKIRRIFSKGKE